MTPTDDSSTHATLADSGDNTSAQDLPRGSNLGRYVIIEPIGSGGMGTVYRAYDPQLNRGVALKILSVKQADQQAAVRAKARLIREAQALAQLSHPNVVAVHDAGTFEDDVFIAMELIEGKTLNDWMNEEKRSIKEILKVMTAAGRGLSAAHKAGLVHRDFKPGNVIVGDDGRVRVLDFGLARAADYQELNEGRPEVSESDERSQESKNQDNWKETSSDSSPNLLLSPLTHEGGVLGTPLYMAPEQHLGLKTDERTDQFGFCVVLYEALYGRRPFSGASMEELKREVVRHQICVPRTDTDVPAWLWEVIRKGLSVKSEDRYTTIDSLLEELQKDPEEIRHQKRMARRRKLFVVSLVLLVVALPIGVWYGMRYRTFQLCRSTESLFDGVWDHATKNSVKESFLGTGKTYALDTWLRVESIFDRYLAEWTLMRSDVCEARLIRGTQSEELFDLRMSCLRKRNVELGALVKVFVRANEGVVQKAIQASASLTEIKMCSDEEALRAPYSPPKTKEEKAQVTAIREKLAEVEALERTGKYKEGLKLARQLRVKAETLGYRPVQAEILYQLGSLFSRTGNYKTAETTLKKAGHLAGENRDILLAAKSITQLFSVVGYKQARYEAGLAIAENAEIMISAAGGDKATQAYLLDHMSLVFVEQGEYDKAHDYMTKSLAIKKVLGSEHTLMADTLNNMGIVYLKKGSPDKAMEYYHNALAFLEKGLGPNHPKVATALYNIAVVFEEQNEIDKAFQSFSRALAISETTLGPDHSTVAFVLLGIGEAQRARTEHTKAQAALRRALAILEKKQGSEHPNVAHALNFLSRVFQDQGKYDLAHEHLSKAFAIIKKSLGPEHPLIAETLYIMGGVFRDQREYDKALAYQQKSLAIWEKALGSEHPVLVKSLSAIGDVLVDQGRPQQAIRPLERAVGVCRKKTCRSEPHGRSLFALARALMSTGRDKERAIKLAKESRERFGTSPRLIKRENKRVDAWLKKQMAEKVGAR